jgi:hypothetical protein
VTNSGRPSQAQLDRDQRLQKIKDRWKEQIAPSVDAGIWQAPPDDLTADQMLQQANADVNWLISQLPTSQSADGVGDALAALTRYVRHDPHCATRLAHTDCNCGASAALQALYAALRGPPLKRAQRPEQGWLADFWGYWRADPAGEWFSDFLESAKVAFEARAAGHEPGRAPQP